MADTNNVINFTDFKNISGNPNVSFAAPEYDEEKERIIKALRSEGIYYTIVEDNTDNKNGIISIRVGAGKTGNPQRRGDDEMTESSEKVTQKDLDILKNNLEQKIEMNQRLISNSIESLKNETNLKFDSIRKEIDLKFDNQYLKIETLLNQKFNDQKEKQSTNTKWIIGTVIAVVGLGLTIAKFFI